MEIRFTGVVEQHTRIDGKPAIQVRDNESNFIVDCVFTDSSAMFGPKEPQDELSPCQMRDLIQIGDKVDVRAILKDATIINLFAEIITIFDNNLTY